MSDLEQKMGRQTYSHILFDLDGTLTDSKLGITRSVQFALEKFDIHVEDLSELNKYIGPPLHKSFEIYNSFDPAKAKTAVQYFREYFATTGIFENELFPGIKELLSGLKSANKTLILATSKPIYFAEKILDHFEINSCFNFKTGSNLDGSMTDKTEIIAHILNHYNDYNLSSFVMIGDREHDIIGAKNNGIHSIGAAYGFGSTGELEKQNPDYIVKTVEELNQLIL